MNQINFAWNNTFFLLTRVQQAAGLSYSISRVQSCLLLKKSLHRSFRSRDGWSMMPMKYGVHNWVWRQKLLPGRVYLRKILLPLVLPIKERQLLFGKEQPVNQFTMPLCGRTEGPQHFVMN